jgi:hypothetical protein
MLAPALAKGFCAHIAWSVKHSMASPMYNIHKFLVYIYTLKNIYIYVYVYVYVNVLYVYIYEHTCGECYENGTISQRLCLTGGSMLAVGSVAGRLQPSARG